MARNIPDRNKKSKRRKDEPTALVIEIDGKQRKLTTKHLQDDEELDDVDKSCKIASTPVKVSLTHLMQLSGSDRIRCLSLLHSLTCKCKYFAHNTMVSGDLLEAVYSLVVDHSNLDLHQTSKIAALEAAVICYPNALDAAKIVLLGSRKR